MIVIVLVALWAGSTVVKLDAPVSGQLSWSWLCPSGVPHSSSQGCLWSTTCLPVNECMELHVAAGLLRGVA